MVSIILSTYNRAHTLKVTIDSILNQTYEDLELIIVDDGSTDNTKELIESYKDNRIRTFYLKENQFYCVAANLGMEKAEGEYIAFATSDDIWESEKLEVQIDYMKKRPECGACFSFADMIDENGKNANMEYAGLAKLFSENHYTQKEWIQRFYLEGNCLSHPSAVVRKDVMDEVGGYNLMFCQSADMELWFRIVRKYPIHVIEKMLVHYRCYRNPLDQVGGVDELKTARFVNEHMMIRRKFIEDLTDQEMVCFFGDMFRNPDSASHSEIEIEKAFLLMNCSRQLPELRVLGIEKLEKLLHNPENLRLLKEKYHVTIHDIYKWNLGHFYVDYGISERLQEQERQIEDKQERLRIEKEALSKEKEFSDSLRRQRKDLNEELKRTKEKINELEEKLEQMQERCVTAERNLETTGRELQEITGIQKNTQLLLEEAILEKLQIHESRKFKLFKK